MKSLRFKGWRCLAVPPLAAWLGACSAHGDANLENLQSARSAAAETAGNGGQSAESPAAEGGGLASTEPGDGGGAGGGGSGGQVPDRSTASAAVSGRSGSGSSAGGAGSVAQPAAGGSSAAVVGGGGAGAVAGASGSAGAAAGSGAGGSAAASVTFSQVYAVLMAGCSCHAAGAGGLDLGSRALAHANLVGVGSRACADELRVAPGAPDRSVLVHALENTDLAGCSVPQMPVGGAMLGASELATVRAWIAAGAKDD